MPTKPITAPEAPAQVPGRDGSQATAHLEGDAVLACVGELDPSTNPGLRRSLNRLLRLAPDRVVVDLSRVSFFDAGAIGELVRARTTSRMMGGDLVVRRPSPFGRRVLKMVGLTNLTAGPGQAAASSDGSEGGGAYGEDLVSAWEAACASPRYGSAPMVFDATTTITQLLSQLDEPPAASGAAPARRDETSAATAVLQLWALSDVLHTGSTTAGAAFAHDERRHRGLGAAVTAMAVALLRELEQATSRDDRAQVRGGPETVPSPGILTRALAEPALELADQLRAGSRSSVVIEKAKGLVAEHFGIGISEAAAMLEAFSSVDDGQAVEAVAVSLIDGSVDVARLAPHSPGGRTTSQLADVSAPPAER